METKYLYVTLSGGLNDRMSNIYRAYKYCCRMGRILLVDFKTNSYSPSKDYNTNLRNILSLKQENIISDSNIINSLLNENEIINLPFLWLNFVGCILAIIIALLIDFKRISKNNKITLGILISILIYFSYLILKNSGIL